MQNISPAQLKELIKQGNAIIIDVREPFEFQSGHIKNAISIPASKFTKDKIPNDKSKKIIFHCKAGKRSEMLLKNIAGEGYLNLEGGIDNWLANGFAIHGKTKMPIDQQFRLSIGIIILISSILAYFINFNFVFVNMFIGAGLVFSGITGFCGLQKILGMAPWNKITN